jgi:leucyl aminopeptidase (aminopeptidase T)
VQQVARAACGHSGECISRNQTNWAVIAAASPAGLSACFQARAEKQMGLLWDAIRHLCRLDQPDPIGAWSNI